MGNAACGSSHHHTPPPIPTSNFVFYAAGTDSFGLTYSIAGVVQITADGNNTILGGVQDFNDGAAPPDGIGTSPTTGDAILPQSTDGSVVSTLVFSSDGSGNATLTLVTNNPALGVPEGAAGSVVGVETFALSFANASHALIAEFDGTATSLGSYDLQTLPSAPIASTSFSFTAAGVDANGDPTAEGGVFSLDSSGNVTSSVDINDGGVVTLANPASVGTLIPASDTFGRGTVTGSLDGTPAVVNFYIVNSEVIRLIDVDTTDTAVGSAYGQGASAGTVTNAFIGTSVFSVAGVDDLVLYNAVGQFTTVPAEADAKPKANLRGVHPNGQLTLGTFAGIADVNETVDGGPLAPEAAFNGTYSFDSNGDGRGNFTFSAGPTDDIAVFGVYAVDPTLNILDPNNPPSTTPPTSPALLVELDANLIGNGLLLPQPATPAVTDIAADVAFGAQANTTTEAGTAEFELLGSLATDAGSVAGEGFIDDPAGILNGTSFGDSGAIFSGTFTDDGEAIGRYTSGSGGFLAMSPLNDGEQFGFTVTAYDANGNQLFWIDMDTDTTWGGPIEASTFTVPVDDKAPAKPKNKKQ
jgi:hypothetical protein